MTKYSRLYCTNCKVVYGISTIGYLKNCTECGQVLILKSFNPWAKVVGGIVLISVGLITMFFTAIPIIWIGAFIWGGSLIMNSLRQWSKIKKLDSGREAQHEG